MLGDVHASTPHTHVAKFGWEPSVFAHAAAVKQTHAFVGEHVPVFTAGFAGYNHILGWTLVASLIKIQPGAIPEFLLCLTLATDVTDNART